MTRQLGLTSKLTLAMVPLAAAVLVLGLLFVSDLTASETGAGFSETDAIAWTVAVVVVLVALGSLFAAFRMGQSMSRRLTAMTRAARRMGNKDLVDLLDALRNPDADLSAIAPLDLDVETGDEIGELAGAFQDMHRSLVDVGARQMESLRAGVSNILVTLARRNSSLVDRQLALLDELESREDDPETLGGYYQVDHLAARMRRNAESLLVLAGSESPRVWAKTTEMTDVVRGALGEVDEYQRAEMLALEPARLAGGAVADVAHLLAELLENALQFSPPSETVRVTGLFAPEGYELSITDRGVGLSDHRIDELNRILERPPSLGLSVEPTMGMYVVAMLAHRHGITVRLMESVPGITARVTLPRDLLESGQSESAYTGAAEVIDLTKPEMTEPDPPRVAPRPAPVTADTGGLPIRVPGQAFREDDESPSVAAGETAAGMKTALTAFAEGRKAAETVEGEDDV